MTKQPTEADLKFMEGFIATHLSDDVVKPSSPSRGLSSFNEDFHTREIPLSNMTGLRKFMIDSDKGGDEESCLLWTYNNTLTALENLYYHFLKDLIADPRETDCVIFRRMAIHNESKYISFMYPNIKDAEHTLYKNSHLTQIEESRGNKIDESDSLNVIYINKKNDNSSAIKLEDAPNSVRYVYYKHKHLIIKIRLEQIVEVHKADANLRRNRLDFSLFLFMDAIREYDIIRYIGIYSAEPYYLKKQTTRPPKIKGVYYITDEYFKNALNDINNRHTKPPYKVLDDKEKDILLNSFIPTQPTKTTKKKKKSNKNTDSYKESKSRAEARQKADAVANEILDAEKQAEERAEAKRIEDEEQRLMKEAKRVKAEKQAEEEAEAKRIEDEKERLMKEAKRVKAEKEAEEEAYKKKIEDEEQRLIKEAKRVKEQKEADAKADAKRIEDEEQRLIKEAKRVKEQKEAEEEAEATAKAEAEAEAEAESEAKKVYEEVRQIGDIIRINTNGNSRMRRETNILKLNAYSNTKFKSLLTKTKITDILILKGIDKTYTNQSYINAILSNNTYTSPVYHIYLNYDDDITDITCIKNILNDY